MELEGKVQEIVTDVLVIGGGMAATMAAIEAQRHGVRVTLVDKGKLGRSGTSPRCGGGGNDWALFPPEFGGDPRDSHDVQLLDCVHGGDFLNVQEHTEIFNREALERLIETEGLGVKYYHQPDGKYNTRKLMSFTYPRGAGRAVGGSLVMMKTVSDQVFSRGIEVLERVMITRLFTREGRVNGAMGINTRTDELFSFAAKNVVLAAGSATGIYKHPTCENEVTGDAYALAYKAGAELMNMEFWQFSITGRIKGMHIKRTGGIKPLTNEGARWVNAQGERVLEKYDPERLELTDWWRQVYAVHKEYEEGRGPVYIDMSHMPEKNRARWEDNGEGPYEVMLLFGLSPARYRLEIMPGLHTFLGGARINERAETTLPGLYAAGESAGQGGIFGADRTGGGIPAAQVFGHRAGKYAAIAGAKQAKPEIDRIQLKEEVDRLLSLANSKGEDPFKIEQRIKDIALEGLSIARKGPGLQKALDGFNSIYRMSPKGLQIKNMDDLIKALEVSNLALTGILTSTSALMRKESRGAHRREDFPERNDREWLKWIVMQESKGEMKVNTVPVPTEKYKIKPRE